jgi:NhaP-type Na+/H+ or K+/H+ antiporter
MLSPPQLLTDLGWGGWLFGIAALFAVRPLTIAVALAGYPSVNRERVVAAWFGPRGFASVVFGLLIVSSNVHRAELLFHLIAITTALSILLHSSTDVPVARWLERRSHAAQAG